MLALATVVVMGVASVAAVPNPRPASWVSDEAHILSSAARQQLDEVAGRLHASRGIELAVVTVDDVRGAPKQFATELFNAWGIGSAQSNNGVLVLLVRDRRRLEIETGRGIEAALTADWLATMEARVMVPRFKAGDFAGGLIGGVQAIEEHIRHAPAESTSTAPRGEYRTDERTVEGEGSAGIGEISSIVPAPGGGDPRWGFVVGVGAGVLCIALWTLGGWLVRRYRRCPVCVPARRMIKLDEVADDAHLEPGQRAEEEVGSVNYIVLLCSRCQATRTRRRSLWWLSEYEECPHCSYTTRRSVETTLRLQTYTQEGEVEVSTSCAHCENNETRRYTIPRHVRAHSSSDSSWLSSGSSSSSYDSSSSFDSSSSSSDSSSSSHDSGFGGGSSDGGGAGSSW